MSTVKMPEKEDLPSNSFATKKPKPPTKKSKAEVDRRKPKQMISQPSKKKKSFLESELSEAKNYMVDDIVIPRVRDMVMEIIEGIFGMATEAIESAIFGSAAIGHRSSRRSYAGRSRGARTPYNSLYDYGRGRSMRKRGIDYDEEEEIIEDYRDVVIQSRSGRAEDTIKLRDDIEEEIYNILEDEGEVTVGDLNYILGIDTGPYTNEDYGWRTLSGMRFKKIRGGGYVIDMPRPRPL